MNDYPYLRRYAAGLLERAMAVTPVVALMGARQTGKSTLVQNEPFLGDRLYLTLDDLEARERAATAPDDFVRSAPRRPAISRWTSSSSTAADWCRSK